MLITGSTLTVDRLTIIPGTTSLNYPEVANNGSTSAPSSLLICLSLKGFIHNNKCCGQKFSQSVAHNPPRSSSHVPLGSNLVGCPRRVFRVHLKFGL